MRVLILLPPSEGKTAPASGPSLDLDSLLDAERLTSPRREVISALTEVSRRPDSASVLGLGPRSAEQTTGRRALRSHCVILSGLWGALSPTDLVPDHRLSMGTCLPGTGRLPSFWKPYLAPSLTGMAAQGLVVDCRSADYAAAWKPSVRNGIEVITVCVVRITEDGSHKVVSHMAKQARGLLTGELLRAVAGKSLSVQAHADDIANIAGRLNGVDDVEMSEPDRQGRRVLTLATH